jgi:hypothetical protein
VDSGVDAGKIRVIPGCFDFGQEGETRRVGEGETQRVSGEDVPLPWWERLGEGDLARGRQEQGQEQGQECKSMHENRKEGNHEKEID